MTIEQILENSYPGAQMVDSFDTLGLDSLEYLSFLGEVEKAFDMSLPPRYVFKTPQDVANWVACR